MENKQCFILSRWLIITVALLSRVTTAQAQSAVHVNVVAASGTPQTAGTGQQFLSPFVAHVTYDDGSPVVGATIDFYINGCLVFSTGAFPSCPPASLYGHFASDSQPITDANGDATAPLFIAGTSPGQYSVLATVTPSEIVNGEPITDYPFADDLFFLTQVDTAHIPALSGWGLLALALAVIAGLRFARRENGNHVSLR